MLSAIEKIIFLKQVSLFQNLTLDHLKVLSTICEEEEFAKGRTICEEGEPGGTLYVVVLGKVAIERTGRRKGTKTQVATLEANACIGEMTLFDNGLRTATAVALQNTLTISLRREPLLALTRQYPDLLLDLINILSQRLRETSNQVAKHTRSQPRELHRLFDELDA
jgi:CRP-like cAMP-binding protein